MYPLHLGIKHCTKCAPAPMHPHEAGALQATHARSDAPTGYASSVPKLASARGGSTAARYTVPAQEDLSSLPPEELLGVAYKTWRKLCQILFAYQEMVSPFPFLYVHLYPYLYLYLSDNPATHTTHSTRSTMQPVLQPGTGCTFLRRV